MTAWWISWYSLTSAFELHSPWWFSGAATVVAAVRAPDEAAAKELILAAHDERPAELRWRFCDPLEGSPFSDRFPKSAWMAWEPDGRTCNCETHRV